MFPIKGIHEYNNSAEMQLDMEQQCRGSCFSINFQSLPDLGTGSGINYSLSSNRIRISPKKRFVNDDEINHQKSTYRHTYVDKYVLYTRIPNA